MLAPVAAVLLFLAAIVSAFGYLRLEEMDREQEAVKRDVEYAQQRVRLRLLERQEQLMRIARDISNKEVDPEEFMGRAESMVSQYPELQAVTWIDERRRILASYAAPSVTSGQLRVGRRDPARGRNREHLQPGARPAAAGLLAAGRGQRQHRPAAAAHPADRAGPLRRRDPGRVLHRRPAALRRAGRGLGQVRGRAAGRQGPRAGRQLGAGPQSGHAAAALGRAAQRVRGAGLAGGQRPDHPGPGLPHLAGRDRQRPVLAGRRAERHDGLDADRQLAPHPPPDAGAAGAGGGDQLPPRDGKLHADRHARAGHAGPHHLRQRGVLPDDGLERSRAGRPHAALPLLARGRPRAAAGRGWTTNCTGAPRRAASRCGSSARTAACSTRACTCRR